ncbi:MAG: ArsA family ATPase [Actinobacteria bacterium]|nr:ArsA family ATPase [Actinomycetota bacterium]
MRIDEFLDPTILIVSGKGGVGKTTVSASLALVAARQGRKVCVVEVDQKGTLTKLLGGREAAYEPTELTPRVWGVNITAERSLAEYLEVQYHMKRISKVFTSSHFVDYIATAAPGLEDILILGKIWYLEKGRNIDLDFDTIIVDAPAAGHMLTFLSAPMGLSDAVRVGPIKRQSEWLVEMLQDPKRSRVHLVTLPEEMPVSETLETAAALDGKVGIATGSTFANAVYRPLLDDEERSLFEEIAADGSIDELCKAADRVGLSLDGRDLEALEGYAGFLQSRREIQEGHLARLHEGTGEVIDLPFLFSAGLALPDVESLADVIEAEVATL